MPRLLKSETNRRLVVSQRALALAFSLLAIPKTIDQPDADGDGAIEIGLIGIAADLAISACLYEVYGQSGIIRSNSGFYLSASEALSSFRKLLDSKIPRVSNLTAGVQSPDKHLKELDAACTGFSVIFTARAGAVHAGAGTSRDVAFQVGSNVANFLVKLAKSPKWKPYLKMVPKIPTPLKDRTLIAQELAALVSSGDQARAGASLVGVFLVLPELTKNEPEWIKTIERVQVTPRQQDISVLLKTLQEATVGHLRKVGKGASAIAAKIDPTNSSAMPIYIEAMKKTFESLIDSWGGFIGNANGQLEKNILSLPPIPSVYSFAAAGVGAIGLSTEEVEIGLPAHSVWPFVAAALNYSGTKGPVFWAVRSLKNGEFGQLASLLNKASMLSKILGSVLPDYLPLIKAASENTPAPKESKLAQKLSAFVETRKGKRERLPEVLKTRIRLSAANRKSRYRVLLTEVSKGDALATPITLLANETPTIDDTDFFPALGLLIDAATDCADLSALTAVVGNSKLNRVSTHARKAIQEIDYAFYGPKLKA